MRACILLNPHAGSADEERLRACARHHVGAVVKRLSSPDAVSHAVHAASAAGASRIVAAGGDGTVHQVANAMLAQNVAAGLGIVPCGTGNDLAYALDLPRLWAPALNTALAAPLKRIDSIRLVDAEGRATCCINGTAGGFAGDVGDAVTPAMKARWGPSAFVMALGKALLHLSPYRVRVVLDESVIAKKIVALLVMNAKTIGGRRHVAPHAHLADGEMDVVLVRYAALPRLLATGVRLLRRRWRADALVETYRCRRLQVTAHAPLALNVDGEAWSNRSFEATVMPRTLRVAAPRQPV